jgi:hypothetical protein
MDAAPPARGRRPWRKRAWLVLALAGAGLFAAIGLGFALLTLHFKLRPSVAEHLRKYAVEPSRFELEARGNVVVAGGDAWRSGDVDPFEVEEHDAEYRVRGLCFEIDIEHGDLRILRLMEELAVVEERASGNRVGVALRVRELEAHPDLRALVRTYLRGVEDSLEGEGHVTLDVVAGAGTGPEVAAVISGPEVEVPGPDPRPGSFLGGLLRLFVPATATDGLSHHVRSSCWLSWKQLDGGSQGFSYGRVHHEASTEEYSYEVSWRVSDFGESSACSTMTTLRHHVDWSLATR